MGDPVRLCRQTKIYTIFQEPLMRMTKSGPKHVPSPQQKRMILEAMHSRTSHCRVQISTQFESNSFWRPSLQRDISAFLKTCHERQLNSMQGKHVPPQRKPVSGLFDTSSVEFADPLMKTNEGNRFIIVGVQHLCRWLVAKALPSQTADVAVRLLVDNIVATFGSPRKMLSDQGPAFTSGA